MKFVKSLAIAASAFVACSAFGQIPVKFSLDWRFEGPAAPYLWALEKGYYKAEGLDVTIDAGNGANETINRVASGTYDIGFGDVNSIIRYRDKKDNPPVTAVAMIYNAPPFAIISLAKNGIKKPKDLEGKILGAPAADGAFAQWKSFVAANKIDEGKVKIENVGFPVREPMLVEGKVQAITGFAFSSYINLRSRGIPQDGINVMLMREQGLDLYGNVIMVNPSFSQKNPQAVRGFVKATLRAWKEVITNQREAVKLVIKRNPIADEQWEAIRLKMAIDLSIITKEVEANGLGAIDNRRMARAIDQIAAGFTFTNKPKVEEIFDASFLPPKAERMLASAK